MSRAPRFEVARTDAGWHGRFRAANGRVVWTTEVYRKEKAAFRAIGLIAAGEPRQRLGVWEVEVAYHVDPDFGLLEVRVLDERSKP